MNVHMDRRAFVSKALLGGLVGAGLAAFPRLAESAVDVHIGINVPAPPRLVAALGPGGRIRAERARELLPLRQPLLRL
jgi:hypothetical protein